MFDTVLIANRGEIAVRVIRTVQALGLRAVAVYSDPDRTAPHVALADEAVHIGPAAASHSYLSIEKIIDACRTTGAQAVHPGYGFLSENAAFAQALADADLTFIGPPVGAITAMGDKISAKELAVAADAPIVPGVYRPGMTDEELIAEADGVGYPLMVKAAAGGGGKGMRIVSQPGELQEMITAARREAMGGFGDDTMMLERYVEQPRHIEIQILADGHGTTLWVGERECSLQRRHQKVIEECHSPVLSQGVRVAMGEAAVRIAREVGYEGAGTVEFITNSEASEFFFLEMNTRLQVEHPVTEEVYRLDLVEQQIRVAAGERLSLRQEELLPSGHAVEARLYAEDPARGFLPTGGQVVRFDVPEHAGLGTIGPTGVRVDAGVQTGNAVTADYDPMVAKLTTYGPDRAQALARLDRALARTVLFGFPTNIGFLRDLIALDAVSSGDLHTGLIEEMAVGTSGSDAPPEEVLAAVALATVARRQRALPTSFDPFDIPGGWRVGEPSWTRWPLRPVGATAITDVFVRVTRDGMEVRIADGAPSTAQVRLADGQLVVEYLPGGHLSGRFAYALTMDDAQAWIGRDGRAWLIKEEGLAAGAGSGPGGGDGALVAPMPGSVAAISAVVGDSVESGQTLVVVEAMKMEHPLKAPFDGTVVAVHVEAGEQVGMEAPLVDVEPHE
ncbi:acetyl/propionyl/methylcrotonyl-CoA carboxylase subunit alpha [Euzebya tangerina]|uniref:acetyl/propionyl/methylcrotonyl-CoA carboxylase subunit alpha n=1 Tax=Euzebya tangerina TaxID=591198 RepID=UPI002F2C8365